MQIKGKYHRFLFLVCFFWLGVNFLASGKYTRKQYINKFQKITVKESRKIGMPASIKMAQAILESGNGNSELAQRSNNHFGIKCHKDWKKKSVKHDDDAKGECFRKYKNPKKSFEDHSEFLQKKRYQFLFNYPVKDYVSWAHGLKKAGYATNPKYPALLIKIIEDEKLYLLDGGKNLSGTPAQTQKEKEKVVAAVPTEPGAIPPPGDIPAQQNEVYHQQKLEEKTAEKLEEQKALKGQIERHKAAIGTNPRILSAPNVFIPSGEVMGTVPKVEKTIFDSLSDQTKKRLEYIIMLESLNKSRIQKNNGVKFIAALKGETFEMIADAYNIPTNNIYLYNNLKVKERQPEVNEVIYINPKKNKNTTAEFHAVKKGETLWTISQIYGVKARSLARKNLMKFNAVLDDQQKIWLKKKKDRQIDYENLSLDSEN